MGVWVLNTCDHFNRQFYYYVDKWVDMADTKTVGTVGSTATERTKYDTPRSVDGLPGMVATHDKRGESRVDEVKRKSRGGDVVQRRNEIRVYVEPDVVAHDSPPRELNEALLELGYAYVDWAANGVVDDDRAIFVYREIGDGVSDDDQQTVGSVSMAE